MYSYNDEINYLKNKIRQELDSIDCVMFVAIYPSITDVPEGLYGTGVWGNIILNINAMNHDFNTWIPYVFAHEYHHNVWGYYWYCLHNGDGLCGCLIENILIEGEADAFAESILGDMKPSWHNSVRSQEEDTIWEKFKNAAEERLLPEEAGKYLFGSEELGIPQYAGYYFGIRIIRDYMKKTQIQDMKTLLETPLDVIYRSYVTNTSYL